MKINEVNFKLSAQFLANGTFTIHLVIINQDYKTKDYRILS